MLGIPSNCNILDSLINEKKCLKSIFKKCKSLKTIIFKKNVNKLIKKFHFMSSHALVKNLIAVILSII